MNARRVGIGIGLALVGLAGCATVGDDAELGAEADAIASANAWYLLDAANGLGAATVSVANGYKVECPDGHFGRTCEVRALVVPADCNFECTDGLLGLQGVSLVRGSFEGDTFVIAAGFDTFARDLGTRSIYRITGAPTCAHDPCPTGLLAQKLDTKAKPTAIVAVDFAHAVDPNYVLDPTRGDAQVASDAGLLVTGHIVLHVFRVDRVFRLETPAPACDPQLAARAHVSLGSAPELYQARTVAEAERHVDPNQDPEDMHVTWLVRTAETPTTVTFTSGINDLWAERFVVAKTGCAITTIAEH
ncbi:MAG: hypothetical protein NT062_02220 [Proteobacteria bacterium]|nr:hypothetical protein [Pseudomonadota bacterium]